MTTPKKREPRTLKKIKVTEISAVRKGAQAAIGEVLAKSADDPPERIAKQAALTTASAGHTHTIALDYGSGELSHGSTDYQSADSSEVGHWHSWVRTEDGSIVIGEADGHTHTIDVLSKGSDDAAAASSKSKKDDDDDDDDERPTDPEDEDQMTKQGTPEPGEKLAKERDEAVARAERAEAICKLSSDQRAHFDTLTGDAQSAFLAEPDANREQIVKAAGESDPVVYTRTNGTAIRKSAGDLVIEMAKEADAMAKALAESAQTAERQRMEKRADDELAHLPGTTAERAELLSIVEKHSQADSRPRLLEILKSHDGGMQDAVNAVSSGIAKSRTGAAGDNPQAKLDALAKAYQEEHECDEHSAMAKVLTTPEGSALMSELVTY